MCLDYLGGRGPAEGEGSDYGIDLDGDPPDVEDQTFETHQRTRDDREFSGLYGQLEYGPVARWRLQAGARLNHTAEQLGTRSVNPSSSEAVT